MRFLLVDRIAELVPLKQIVAEKYIDPSEDYLRDHFPGFPIVPGVLMVEMMAQTAGKCLMAGIEASRWPVLLQVIRGNFRKIVHPGVTLRMHARITSVTAATAAADAFVERDGERVADASLLFGYVDRNFLSPGYQDEVLRDYLQRQGGPGRGVV
jgi:3-hydroxyacyl-[acyl-carrier-protein] dehydratase